MFVGKLTAIAGNTEKHSVDPDMARLLAELAGAPVVDLMALPVAESRAAYEAKWAPWNAAPPAVAACFDLAFAGPRGDIAARLVTPSPTAEGLILFMHGGGWMFGSLDSHDRLARELALRADAHVLSVDYALTPEHAFPDPLDDVLAGIDAARNGELPVERSSRIAVAGDSAGATLALGALLEDRERSGRQLAGAALFYGCYATDFSSQSYRAFGDGAFGLSRARMETFWNQYLNGNDGRGRPSAVPGAADLSGLPPVFVHAAGLDVLRDDSVSLAGRLAAQGNRVRLEVVPGLVHGHLQMVARLPPAQNVLEEAGRFLRPLLRRDRQGPDRTS